MTWLVRSMVVALALGFGSSAFAQEAGAPDGEGGESPGSGPLPGYVVTGMLAGAAMFVLCKSARR